MANHPIPKYCDTKQAADALNRQAATLRKWASTNTGPLKPVRVNGRLAWSVDEISALLMGGEKQVDQEGV